MVQIHFFPKKYIAQISILAGLSDSVAAKESNHLIPQRQRHGMQ